MARKGIYKRGNMWWICYADLAGKVVRKSTGTSDYRQAETQLLSEKKAVREGKISDTVKIKNHTFHELRDKYLEWMKGHHKSADSKEYRIENMVTHFGDLPLRRFNTLLVEQYQTALTNKGLKPGSVNKNISILKAMIKKAVDWEMVEEETLKRVRKVKNYKEANRRLRFLSVEETQNLVNVCDEHLRPIVVTALHTGCRRGEILKLTWDHVDLVHGFITLTDTKNGERREIPIDATLRETLNKLPRRFVEVESKDGKKEKELVPYLFHDPKTMKRYSSVKRSFLTALGHAKIKDFKFHDLRHTFASHLVMAGVDLTTVKELLGHKDIKMTLRYAHLAPAHKRSAVNVLDSLLSKPTASEQPTNCTITSQPKEKDLAVSS